jgi:hypothetical protein
VASTDRILNIKPENRFFSHASHCSHESQRLAESTNSEISGGSYNLSTLTLEYGKEELVSYTTFRMAGISKASVPWMKKCSQIMWSLTHGKLNKGNVIALRDFVLAKYSDLYAQRKVLNFSKAFLKHLAKTRFDPRYAAFDLFLELPKSPKTRKRVTSRIVMKTDVENVLCAVEHAYETGEIDWFQRVDYKAIVLFSAFTGQRCEATTARLKVGQFREAISQQKPVIDILPEQDKIRMQHYCPLHPQVVDAVRPLLDGRQNEERIFAQLSFARWLRKYRIPLRYGNQRFVPGDLRKYCEQQGDMLRWNESNRAYVLTHGVAGVQWSHYRNPLPEHVYDVYIKYWADVTLGDQNVES